MGVIMIKQQLLGLLISGAILLMITGCGSLLPKTHNTIRSPWTNYAQVEVAFAQIITYQTRTNDLRNMGFDPSASPNVRILNYMDLIQRFIPNASITIADLPEPVRDCIDAKENCRAYELDLSDIRTKRHGNTFLDVFGFKRQTHEYGWRFNGLVLILDGQVVYKISEGEPTISN